MRGCGNSDRRASIGVAIATHNRRVSLRRTLDQLTTLPEQPPIVVVDNGSSDGTPEMVETNFPQVGLLALGLNRGVSARNLAAEALPTPLVAFSDDDSWWTPGAFERAHATFDRFPGLTLLAAQILVGAERRLDPTCELMAGPPAPHLPGPEVDGFVACGAIVRRDAFLHVGGFCDRFFIGAEEGLLAFDLRAEGGRLCYVEGVRAVHMPDRGPRGDRSWLQVRNDLWTTWLRGSRQAALRETLRLGGRAISDTASLKALASAIHGLPWALRERRAPIGEPMR